MEDFCEKRTSVTVTVPATCANMGSGFDCVGMALDVWNDLTVELSDKFEMEVEGEGKNSLPRDESNLVVVGLKRAFEIANKPVPPLKYICFNRIPQARGLGSSSAALVSGLIAGLFLSGHQVAVQGEEVLFNMACDMEGHPDNVAPAIYGGMQIGNREEKIIQKTTQSLSFELSSPKHQIERMLPSQVLNEQYKGRWRSHRVKIPSGLQCVLYIPDFELETSKARGILPSCIPREDAIFNSSRLALMINAMNSGDLNELRYAMQDKLHQPYRCEQNKHLYPLIEAAIGAGSHGACLSGAGPAVLALTSGSKGDVYSQMYSERTEEAVAEAMLKAADKVNIKGKIFLTHPTEKGAHVVKCYPPVSCSRVKHYTHTRGDGQPL